MTAWTLWARNRDGDRVARVDEYRSAKLTARHNQPGSFTVDEIPTGSEAGVALSQPGSGIEAEPVGGSTLFSGPVLDYQRVWSPGTGDLITVTGADDMIWLTARLASPQPDTVEPPYDVDAYDIRTGPAGVVIQQFVDHNAGPSAHLGRQIPGLTIRADPPYGAETTARGRWQQLLTLIDAIATNASIGFQVRGLEFGLYTTAGTPHLFTPSVGNVERFRVAQKYGGANWAYVGGDGEGTDRLIAEAVALGPLATWGRWETFVDKRDADTADELMEAGYVALERTASELPGVTVDSIDKPGSRFGTDYNVGTIARVEVDGVTLADQIREVRIDLAAGAAIIRPTIGPRAQMGRVATFRTITQLAERVTNLERR